MVICFGTKHLRKIYLNGFSPFGLTSTVWKSTGNVITDHLSSSSSTSSVSALNKPGIPSRSSTCDWRDTFRVSVGFGHISGNKKIASNEIFCSKIFNLFHTASKIFSFYTDLCKVFATILHMPKNIYCLLLCNIQPNLFQSQNWINVKYKIKHT